MEGTGLPPSPEKLKQPDFRKTPITNPYWKLPFTDKEMAMMKRVVEEWNEKHPNKNRDWRDKIYLLVAILADDSKEDPSATVWSRFSF